LGQFAFIKWWIDWRVKFSAKENHQ
jgi:hypothetical protein